MKGRPEGQLGLVNWVENLLASRKITFERGVRRWRGARVGVTTRWVLSPLLWNLVVGPLLKKLTRLAYAQAYADDIVIVVRGKDISTV